MTNVELIFDADCPNVEKARAQIILALKELALPLKWHEWDRTDPAAPSYAQKYASPTVLVDGRDVAGGGGIDGAAGCRVYVDDNGGFQGVPPVQMITEAIGHHAGHRSGWRNFVAVFPALGVIFLPGLTCPACWPAYAGLLSSLGVGFFNYTPFLFPLTALFLVISLCTFAYRAGSRHGYAPLAVGAIAATLMLTGKFVFASDAILYGGIGLLVGASIWNARPISKRKKETCSCASAAA